MAKRGHTRDGQVVCSECGAIIEKDASECEHCAEPLKEDFNAIVCPYCGSILEDAVTHCTNCGLRFKDEEKSVIRSKEDEEFLSRLLEWGRKLEANRSVDPGSDRFETEKASEVFKDVMGVPEVNLEEDALQDLRESAEEREEFEKREQSILQLAEPLRKALAVRKDTLEKAEDKLNKLQADLEGLGDGNVKAMKKRFEVEKRIAEITTEKDEIRSLEENIENMDSIYRHLLETHKTELIEKEKELNSRLDAFKKEMDRREKEKDRLKSREEFLKQKEEEMERRIRSLKNREASLYKTEEKMKSEIEALLKERSEIEELKEPAKQLVVARGKWLVDEKELMTIIRKSKKVREEWAREQKEIQRAYESGESEEQVLRESEDRFRIKERELGERIKDLENKLIEAKKQDEIIKKEEVALVADEELLKKVLKVLDDLLGNLPDDEIEKFVKTNEFKLYEQLMDGLGL
jgi:chromosome segregation ATPase/ribosomal protein L40E